MKSKYKKFEIVSFCPWRFWYRICIKNKDGGIMKLILGFLIAALFESQVLAQQLELVGVEYGGTGCPQNSVNVLLDPSGQSFTVLYDQFDSRVNRNYLQDQKQCKVILKIRKPKFLGYRIESADFRGFVSLDAGVTATHDAKIQSGSVKGLQKISTEFGRQSWTGPLTTNFYTSTKKIIKDKHQDLFDCLPLGKRDSEIKIDSEIRLSHSGGDRYGQLTVDSLDGKLVQKYYIKWTRCDRAIGDALGGLFRNR